MTEKSISEAITSAPEKTPAETVKKPLAETPNPLEISEENDELEIETDGDVFWLVQHILWGTLKIAVVLGILGGIAWMIWGGDHSNILKIESSKKPVATESAAKQKNEPEKSVPVETPEKLVVPAIATIQVAPQKNLVSSTASWNYWLEKNRLREISGTLADAVNWTKKTESIFEIPFAQQIDGNSAAIRSMKLEKLSGEIYRLLESAAPLQRSLVAQGTEFSNRAAQQKTVAQAAESQFVTALSKSDPTGLEEFLAQKIEAEKNELAFSIEAEAREILWGKIDSYRVVLENVFQNISTNHDAIVQDIRVVDFPSDPFGRVIPIKNLSPAE
ncbi:hypothetical protein HN954_00060 [bacterium]|jgi:hypothetical protein|nr:hypothetical protein [bacterium]MBT6832030.1 hypothetical protein [bacterium]MBT6995811.1 hypothetical protein [bacterium]MBT7772378.1 hypothetical protein [bacterium]